MLRGVELGLWLAASSATVTGRQPAADTAVELTWPRREGCPSADAVRDDIEHRLGRSLDDVVERDLQAIADVSQTDTGWTLRLRIEQDGVAGTRTLQAESCELLARATALLLALAIDPVAVAREQAKVDATEDEPDTVAADPTPSPPVTHAEPTPVASPSREPTQRNAEDTDEPPMATRAQGLVTPGAIVEAGMLPGVGAGVQLAAGFRMHLFSVALAGRYFLRRRQTLPQDSSAGVRLGAWTVGLRGCFRPTPAPSIEVPVCADVEAGQMFGRGFGVEQPRTAFSTWAAAGPAAGIAWVPLRWLALELDVAAMVRITRIVFDLVNAPDVFRPEPVGMRLGLGVSFRFP